MLKGISCYNNTSTLVGASVLACAAKPERRMRAESGIQFEYNPTGHRIEKRIKNDATELRWDRYYYLRDPLGNVMAVYSFSYDDLGNDEYCRSMQLDELHVYGSSRIAVDKPQATLYKECFELTSPTFDSEGFLTGGTFLELPGGEDNTGSSYDYTITRGRKYYEISNHLGNVMSTLRDRKLPQESSGDIINFTPDVSTWQDYLPFGMLMYYRNGDDGEVGRYGFQAQERDDEIYGAGNSYTAEFWQYDSRLGRRWNIDPVDQISISNYAAFINNPIFWIDPLGSTVEPTTDKAKKEVEKYGEKTRINKKRKVVSNMDNYETAFGELYNDWKDRHDVHIKFTTIESDDFGGTISYDGERTINIDGKDIVQQVYSVMWNPNYTEQLGASGIFEESHHLMEALEGKEMAFPDKPNSGVMYVDIYDEVRTKLWVVENIKSVRSQYVVNKDYPDYTGYTHYGYIKKLKDIDVIAQTLQNGFNEPFRASKSMSSSGSSFGGSTPTYKPFGFGTDRYKGMSPISQP